MLGKELGIGYGNANQILNRLNKYSIDREEFISAINKIEKKLRREELMDLQDIKLQN